jgi:DNA-binding beta-propeller fold protein YncE
VRHNQELSCSTSVNGAVAVWYSARSLSSAFRIVTLPLVASASLAVALVSASPGNAAAASSGYTISLVPVDVAVTQVAIDPVTDTLYLTDGSGGKLFVVDAATGAVQATLSLGGDTVNVAVDQATDMVYVTDYGPSGASSVDVVNGATSTVSATISEPEDSLPEGIAADAVTDTIYVANFDAQNLTVIDGKTNAITAVVSTGSTARPYTVAVDDSSDVAWVDDYEGSVIAVDGATNTIASTLSLPEKYATSIAVDPASGTVYVGSREESIYVIDGATTTLTSTIKVPYEVEAVAVDPVAGVVYATTPGSTWIIDAATNTITDSLVRGGSGVVPASTAGDAYEASAQYGLWQLTPSATNALSPIITSASNAIFSTGQAGSATVQASASPAATFTESGTLPAGLTWNSDGTLAGTPAAGTGGYYPVTITASNGIPPNFSQSFGVEVDQPIVITSPATATFQVGETSSFTFESTGYPTPTYEVSGTLPSGVTLLWSQANGWQLTGTPEVGSGGVYPLTITATTFGSEPTVTQAFTLTVLEAPRFTSPAGATFRTGRAGTFAVTAHGYPAATFTTIGSVPSWVKLSLGGVLTGTPPAHAGGSYHFTIGASNGIGGTVRQSFTLVVDQPPAITSRSRATFRVGRRTTFTIRSTGYPDARLTERGRLPRGVTFRAGRNGTAVLTGDPAAADKGKTYVITITAGNGVGPSVRQTFRLTVT